MKKLVNLFLLSSVFVLLFFISLKASAQNYNKLGKKELKKGEYSIAVSYFTKHLKNSEDYKAYINRGIAFTMMNKFEPALSDFNKSIQLKPDFELSYYNRGIAYSKTGKFDEAIKDFQKVIELKPNYTDAYLELGKVYFELNKLEDAKRIFTNLIRIDPSLSAAFLNRGIANLRLQDYENALQDFGNARGQLSFIYSSIAYSIFRDKLRYMLKIGVIGDGLMYNSNTAQEESQRLLNFVRSKDVDNGLIKGSKQQLSEFYKLLGFARYLRWGGVYRAEEIMDNLNKSIEINPTDPIAYLYRGIVRLSIDDFSKAIQLKPDLAIAYFLLGNIYFMDKKYDLAISNYLIALQNDLGKNTGLFYDWILFYHLLSSEYSFNNLYYNIATAYELTGNVAEAEMYFNKQKETDNEIAEYKTQISDQISHDEEIKKLTLSDREEYSRFKIGYYRSTLEQYEFMESFISSYPTSPYLTEIESNFTDLKKKLNEKAALLNEGEEYDLVFLYDNGFVIPRSLPNSIFGKKVLIKNLIDKELNIIVKSGTVFRSTSHFSNKIVTSESKYQLPASGRLRVAPRSVSLECPDPDAFPTAYFGVYASSLDLCNYIQACNSNTKVLLIGILAITEHTSRSEVRNRMKCQRKILTKISRGLNYSTNYHYEVYTTRDVSEDEISEAKRILDNLGIKNNL